MGDLIEKYGSLIIEILTGMFAIGLIAAVFVSTDIINSEPMQNLDQTVMGAGVDYEVPTVQEGDFVVDGAILGKGADFNWKDYVHVRSNNYLDLIDYISVSGEVKTNTPGEYELVFSLNWNGKNIVKKATYYVRG